MFLWVLHDTLHDSMLSASAAPPDAGAAYRVAAVPVGPLLALASSIPSIA